jgi:hypothetical protein
MIGMVKINGFIIFATKLDKNNQDEYNKEIDNLTNTGFWVFTTDHTFYRYEKLIGDIGKFSNRLVKVLMFQKIDHE